jgi:isocitrate lyase
MKYTEMELYKRLAKYIRTTYPDAVFHYDLSGVHNPSRTTRGIYKSLNGSGWPDLFIAYPVAFDTGLSLQAYSGLFLELKAEGVRLRKRDGSWASDHIADQAAVIELLRTLGYVADFAVGLEDATAKIDSYMDQMAKDQEWMMGGEVIEHEAF